MTVNLTAQNVVQTITGVGLVNTVSLSTPGGGGVGVPAGGSSGYALSKLSGADYNIGWAAPGGVTDGDKGDVIVSGTGTVWALDYVAVNPVIAPVASNLTGTLAAARLPAFTGDATAPGGSAALTLATVNANIGAFGGAGLALSATVNAKGLVTAMSTSAIAITASQVSDGGVNGRLVLQGATASANRTTLGLGALAVLATLDLTTLATGTLQAAQAPAYGGDVTSAAGGLTTALATVNANIGAFGSATQVATFTVNAKGLMTAAGNVAIAIPASAISDATTAGRAMVTAATATAQTALLDAATTTVKGLVPAPGSATGKVLSDAMTWITVSGGGSTFLDGVFRVQNSTDATKQFALDLSGFTTGITRTFVLPNASDTIATIAATQTLTNKSIVATQLTGTLQAAQMPAFTGDVTNTGLAMTITANAVTLGDMAQVATNTFLGRTTIGTGNVQALTVTQTKVMLAISLTTDVTGVLQAAQFPAQTGDVTNTAGSLANTIAAGVVINAKLGTMAANTVKANATAGVATPTDIALAASQLFGMGATGNVSAITLGTNLSMTGAVLNAVGGSGAPGGTSGQIQYNNAGAFGGFTMSGDATITTGGVLTIAASAVTLTKQANLAANSVIGNNTGSAAVPAAVPMSSLAAASSVVITDANSNAQNNNTRQGYTATATAGGTTTLTVASTYLQFFTGTLAQTITLPDVTTLVLGHQFYIRNNSTGLVTINSSGGSLLRIIGPNTRAIVTCILTTGTTAASWAAMYVGINITDGKVLAVTNNLTLAGTDATVMTFPNASDTVATLAATQTLTNKSIVATQLTGTLQAAQFPAQTGDVTNTAGSLANTISAGAVTLTKQANIATGSIMGRVTAATGVQEVLTPAQAKTVMAIDAADVTNVVNRTTAQTIGGAKTFSVPMILTGQTTDPASPADGTEWFDSQINTAKVAIGSRLKDVFADLMNSGVMGWKAITGGTSFTPIGIATATVTGTATAAAIATTNKHTMYPRVLALVTVAATTAVAGWRGGNVVTVGGASADLGGFRLSMIWGPETGVATTTNRALCGLRVAATPTDVEPSTILNSVGMGWDAADTNVQMMFNDGTGTATKVDLGASFAVPIVDATSVYKLELYSPKGTTQSVQWRVTDMVSGAVATGTATTKLPSTATLLSPLVAMSVGGTSSVIGVSVMSMYLDPLL